MHIYQQWSSGESVKHTKKISIDGKASDVHCAVIAALKFYYGSIYA
jgi:hypothetical protein